jgi:hypothetical protein
MKRASLRLTLATILALAPRLAAASDQTPLQSLNPDLADHPYGLDPGVHVFEHRLAISPAFGFLGTERLFAMRAEYSPNNWLSYEASIAHNPTRSVHAVLHSFTVNVRHPLAGRWQPFASGGYGMILVFPGLAANADPVTKNALTVGGGMELLIRNDLALRADLKNATVFGRQGIHDGIVAYSYLQETIGLTFSRTIKP